MLEPNVDTHGSHSCESLVQLTYSLSYEKMMYKFFARLDKWATFFTLLFGMNVIASTTNEVFSGVFVALLAVFQLVFTPAAKSYSAKAQYQAYSKCYQDMDKLSVEKMAKRMNNIHEKDSDPIGILSHPARLAGLAMLGMDNRTEDVNEREMKPLEKLAVWFVGETPEYQFSDEPK